MTPRTVADVLDATATYLAQPDTAWQRYSPDFENTSTWRRSVSGAIAGQLAPADVWGNPMELTALRQTADLAAETVDFLAHYLIDYVGDHAVWTGDDEQYPMELDPVETILSWETDAVPGCKLPEAADVQAVLTAAAVNYRMRAAARAEREALVERDGCEA